MNLSAQAQPLAHEPLILVVDDEPAIRALLRAALERAGFRVLDAADAAGALRLAQRRPDAVLLDIALPDASGFEVCRRLKEDAATALIPVLFLTGLAQAREWPEAREVGAAGWIAKPFLPNDLISQIRIVLARKAPASSR